MLYLNDIPELLLAIEFKTSMSVKASLEKLNLTVKGGRT